MESEPNTSRFPPRKDRSYYLFLLPVIGLVCVPFYNRVEPTVLGFPFFYWYQLLCVLITAFITAFVYWRRTRGKRKFRRDALRGARP